jgi:hypothetical protein
MEEETEDERDMMYVHRAVCVWCHTQQPFILGLNSVLAICTIHNHTNLQYNGGRINIEHRSVNL